MEFGPGAGIPKFGRVRSTNPQIWTGPGILKITFLAAGIPGRLLDITSCMLAYYNPRLVCTFFIARKSFSRQFKVLLHDL